MGYYCVIITFEPRLMAAVRNIHGKPYSLALVAVGNNNNSNNNNNNNNNIHIYYIITDVILCRIRTLT